MALFCGICDPSRRCPVGDLEAIARSFSPEVQHGIAAPFDKSAGRRRIAARRAGSATQPPGLLFNISGLQRVLGPPAAIAAEVTRACRERGVAVQVAIAGTMTAAWLLAHARPGTTVIAAGGEADALAPLDLECLRALDAGETGMPALSGATLVILRRWGLRTLGDLARLPEADVRTRLGEIGARLHRAARGLDEVPLVPAGDPFRFCERLELEWPIEGLEPLSFVLGRLCESLASALERADRGAVTLATRLHLVTRATHARELHLPAPMRDPRVLRTLILLDLESHPPPAGIDCVEIEADVTPGRILQGSLLARSLPSSEQLATLLARLRALMGESRVGAPVLVDSHDERAFRMGEFTPGTRGSALGTRNSEDERPTRGVCPVPALRRFRLPIAVSVKVEHGAPVEIVARRGMPGGRIINRAGPWRTSGHWWTEAGRWSRDEWDLELPTGVVRLSLDRRTGRWEIEGVFD